MCFIKYVFLFAYVFTVIFSVYGLFMDHQPLIGHINGQCEINYYIDAIMLMTYETVHFVACLIPSLIWPLENASELNTNVFIGAIATGIMTYPIVLIIRSFYDMSSYGMYERKKMFVD